MSKSGSKSKFSWAALWQVLWPTGFIAAYMVMFAGSGIWFILTRSPAAIVVFVILCVGLMVFAVLATIIACILAMVESYHEHKAEIEASRR